MKTSKLILPFVLAACIASCGCAGTPKMNRLSVGMTKQEVIAVMGNPDSVSALQGVEYLTYYLSPTGEMAFAHITKRYVVRLVNGKVDSYGSAEEVGPAKEPTASP